METGLRTAQADEVLHSIAAKNRTVDGLQAE